MCENCNLDILKEKFRDDHVDLTLIDKVLVQYKGKKGSLISILQDTQELYGFLPLSAMNHIADNSEYKKANIYGVATFYTQFRLNPIGKHLILQCQGTACHVNGSKAISAAICEELSIEAGETSADGLFTVEDVACLGCCSLAPVIMIDGETYGNLTPAKAVEIVKEIAAKEAK